MIYREASLLVLYSPSLNYVCIPLNYWRIPHCADIDECTEETDDCSENADCSNTPGSFQCTCMTGYSGDGTMCNGKLQSIATLLHRLVFPTDIDECTEGTANCGENADCNNTPGSFQCTCREGYTGDGSMCNGTQVITSYWLA